MYREKEESILQQQVIKLTNRLEAMRLGEYLDLLQKPSRLLYLNFLAGVARGLGIAVGATIVFAVLIQILSQLLFLNLPIIGDIIVDIIKIVEAKQGKL